jgi:hypothetical protein
MVSTNKDLENHLSKGSLILSLLAEKLSITNYLLAQLSNDNTPAVLSNHFFIFTTHVYFRSAVIDLCALLADNKKTHKNNFHRIYQDSNLAQSLAPAAVARVKQLLGDAKQHIDEIVALRDTALAHYDLIQPNLSFDTEKISVVNKLFTLSQEILSLCGQEIGIGYIIGFDYFQSLQQLVGRQPV